MRSTAKLCLAVLAVFAVFAGISTAGGAAPIVCVSGDDPATATAVLLDQTATAGQQAQYGCDNPTPPAGGTTSEQHNLTVTLGTGSDPQNPGGTVVNQVTFADSNPIV